MKNQTINRRYPETEDIIHTKYKYPRNTPISFGGFNTHNVTIIRVTSKDERAKIDETAKYHSPLQTAL